MSQPWKTPKEQVFLLVPLRFENWDHSSSDTIHLTQCTLPCSCGTVSHLCWYLKLFATCLTSWKYILRDLKLHQAEGKEKSFRFKEMLSLWRKVFTMWVWDSVNFSDNKTTILQLVYEFSWWQNMLLFQIGNKCLSAWIQYISES